METTPAIYYYQTEGSAVRNDASRNTFLSSTAFTANTSSSSDNATDQIVPQLLNHLVQVQTSNSSSQEHHNLTEELPPGLTIIRNTVNRIMLSLSATPATSSSPDSSTQIQANNSLLSQTHNLAEEFLRQVSNPDIPVDNNEFLSHHQGLAEELLMQISNIYGNSNRLQISVTYNKPSPEEESGVGDRINESILLLSNSTIKKVDDFNKSFVQAAGCGNSLFIENLLSREPKIDINTVKYENITPLMAAAYGGHLSIVEALLQAGIHVNASDYDSNTALIYAASADHANVIKTLLRVPGININAASNGGWTALMSAASKGHVEAVKVLLKATGIASNEIMDSSWTMVELTGPTIIVDAVNKQKMTALMLAAQNGHHEVAKVLLTIPGIGVNATTRSGNTALMLAARNGYLEVVEALLAATDINVDITNNNGDVALKIALTNGDFQIVKALLRARPGQYAINFTISAAEMFLKIL